MGFLPSCGKRMNYGIFATLAIMWQKWQKDELWDFCHFSHHVAKVKRMNFGIFAIFAIMWQKWQKDELWDFCHMWQKWQKDELWDFCHFSHHVAKVAKG